MIPLTNKKERSNSYLALQFYLIAFNVWGQHCPPLYGNTFKLYMCVCIWTFKSYIYVYDAYGIKSLVLIHPLTSNSSTHKKYHVLMHLTLFLTNMG